MDREYIKSRQLILPFAYYFNMERGKENERIEEDTVFLFAFARTEEVAKGRGKNYTR